MILIFFFISLFIFGSCHMYYISVCHVRNNYINNSVEIRLQIQLL